MSCTWRGASCLALVLILSCARARAQAPPAADSSRCLVVPFENRSDDARLNWIGESFVVALAEPLRRSGVSVLDQQQRSRAWQQAGAPADVPLSQATLWRIAQLADARWLITGWYNSDGVTLQATAQVIDLKQEQLLPLPAAGGALTDIESLQAQLAAAAEEKLDVTPAPLPDAPALPLPAYESYVRATVASSPAQRLALLKTAGSLAPADPRIQLALGEANLANGNAAAALGWLQRVPATAAQAPEARFDAAVAEDRLGDYPAAATGFAALAQQWPLPEVTNNLQVAQAQSRHATTTLRLATSFPVDGYRQLATAVAAAGAARLAAMTPAERVSFRVQEAQRLLTSGATAAARADVAAALQEDPTNAEALKLQAQLKGHP